MTIRYLLFVRLEFIDNDIFIVQDQHDIPSEDRLYMGSINSQQKYFWTLYTRRILKL